VDAASSIRKHAAGNILPTDHLGYGHEGLYCGRYGQDRVGTKVSSEADGLPAVLMNRRYHFNQIDLETGLLSKSYYLAAAELLSDDDLLPLRR
jgi:hypothetical protein